MDNNDSSAKTIEEKVAETILQQPVKVTVAGREYIAAPPTVATMILVSAAVSRLPHLHLDSGRVLEESLAVAKDCQPLGDILATLILGAKHAGDPVEMPQAKGKRRLFGRRKRKAKTVTARERLSRELLEELSPRDLHSLTVQLLMKMQVSDFFGLTTFLTEINMTRPTKVVTGQTASGQ